MQNKWNDKKQQKRQKKGIAVDSGKAARIFALFFPALCFEWIAGMRRAAPIEETAEQNQRGKLQEGGLPIGGEPLQEGTRG